MTTLQEAAMTAERAAFFLRRFKSEEKMLGPNEQAAIDFALDALAQQGEQRVCAGCGIPAGDVHMSTCQSGKWPSRVSNGDTVAPSPVEQRCTYCDGTGDVHSIDGEWRGTCHCAAAPAPQAQPVDIEALCARIKAADDAAAEGDYMLDSDDCISVIRGTWKAPMLNDKPAPQAQEPIAKLFGTLPVYDTPEPQAQDKSDNYLSGYCTGRTDLLKEQSAQPVAQITDAAIREIADCIVSNLDSRKGVIDLDLDDDMVEEIMQEMCDTIAHGIREVK